jgi:hypothetical protein
MKVRKKLFIFLILLVAIPLFNAQASQFNISLQNGKEGALDYDSASQYVNIKMEELLVPKKKSPAWYEQIFFNRKDFGIAYFEFSFADKTIVKRMAFQYEKVSRNNYKYIYLLPTEDFPAYLLEKRLMSHPVSMRLVVKNWEGEENISLVKGFVEKLNLLSSSVPEINSQTLAQVLQFGTVALDLIGEVFPPDNTEESATITLDPSNLQKSFTIQMKDAEGNKYNFSKIRITADESLFQVNNGLFDKTIKTYPEIFTKSELAIWEKTIRNADNESSDQDLTPLLNSLKNYNDYIKNLELTNSDIILMLAKSTCRWATESMSLERISANKFSSIAIDGAQEVLNKYRSSVLKNCNFIGGDCRIPITCKAYDFYTKSRYRISKKIAKKYILDSFDLKIEEQDPIKVTIADYMQTFLMKGYSEWTPMGDKTNRTFVFNNRNIIIEYKGTTYKDYQVSMSLILIEGKFYITEISLW